MRSAAPVTQNHLSKPEDLMLQNATLLRKSAADLLTSLMNASANIFETATKPSGFAHFWQGAQSLAPATQDDASTSKWREHVLLLAFSLRNVLRATTARTFSTSELPKVFRS